MQPTRIWSDIEWDRPGKFCGHLRVPLSTNDSAYGWIPIPIASIRNGEGPAILLMAGSHGDEWEGQILLINLIRSLKAEDINGHLIVLPAVNAPAVEAGTRVSPIDSGNLNRCFPGDPNGSPTMMIAHFIETVLLPMVSFVGDFHSGGSSLEYLPSTVVVAPNDHSRLPSTIALLQAFGMPVGFVTDASTGGDRSLTGACDRLGGVACLSTELGGGGGVTQGILSSASEGLLRLLSHLKVLHSPTSSPIDHPTKLFYRVRPDQFTYATADGLFEPFVGLGDMVQAGQEAGAIHSTKLPWENPRIVHFEAGGVVLCRRFPARTKLGDCLFNVAQAWTQ